jgi:DNA-binding GntR family transcriptional regulator
MCRERKARYHFLLKIHRQAHRLTPLGEHIGIALVRRLSTAGQCDPSHDRIAEDVACSPRTVRRALAALKALGLLLWQRRIGRN